MPIDVRITGYSQFRAHLRARHNITRISPEQANRYRCDGGVHVTQRMRMNAAIGHLRAENRSLAQRSNTGVNLSAAEFSNVIAQVQQSISSGIERGMATAFNATAAINYYADVRSDPGSVLTPPPMQMPLNLPIGPALASTSNAVTFSPSVVFNPTVPMNTVDANQSVNSLSNESIPGKR